MNTRMKPAWEACPPVSCWQPGRLAPCPRKAALREQMSLLASYNLSLRTLPRFSAQPPAIEVFITHLRTPQWQGKPLQHAAVDTYGLVFLQSWIPTIMYFSGECLLIP